MPSETPSLATHRLGAAVVALLVALSLPRDGLAGELFRLVPNPGELGGVLYVPEPLAPSPALVVALHGCGMEAMDYDDETGWTALADEGGFLLLLPEQRLANNITRCFNWMLPDDRARGDGEPASIKQMIDVVSHRHRVDRGRIYVTGLSAGAGMTAVMLATYPEVFAGGAPIAGVPYECVSLSSTAASANAAVICMTRGNRLVSSAAEWGRRVRAASEHTGPWPRVSIWNGGNDLIVNPVNADDLVEQWTDVHGTDQEPDATEDVAGYRRRSFHDAGGVPVVEHWVVAGLSHAVPVDVGAGCGIDAVKGSQFDFARNDYIEDVGVCSSRRIAEFWGLLPP